MSKRAATKPTTGRPLAITRKEHQWLHDHRAELHVNDLARKVKTTRIKTVYEYLAIPVGAARYRDEVKAKK